MRRDQLTTRACDLETRLPDVGAERGEVRVELIEIARELGDALAGGSLPPGTTKGDAKQSAVWKQ